MILKVTRVEIKNVSEGAKTPVVIRGVVELDPGEDVGEFLRNNKEFVLVPYTEHVERAKNELYEIMSEFSEVAYCAGWMMENMQACKDIAEGKRNRYCMESERQFEYYKRELIRLHSICGGWWDYVLDVGPVFIPDESEEKE